MSKTRQPAIPVPREAEIVSSAMALYRYRGFTAFRLNSGAIRDRTNRPVPFLLGPDGKVFKGFSDTFAFIPGSTRLIFTEIKRPGGKLSVYQRAFLEMVRGMGHVGVVIDDIGFLDGVLCTLLEQPAARFEINGSRIPGEIL